MADILRNEELPWPDPVKPSKDVRINRWYSQVTQIILSDYDSTNAPYCVAFMQIILNHRAWASDSYAPAGWTAISWERLKKLLHCGDTRLSDVIEYLEKQSFIRVFRRALCGRTYTNLYRVCTHEEAIAVHEAKRRKRKEKEKNLAKEKE